MNRSAAASLVAIDLISDNKNLQFEVAGRMARTIMELNKKNNGCMPQDLNARGFTPTEVVENWDAAHFLIAINDLTSWGKKDGRDKT